MSEPHIQAKLHCVFHSAKDSEHKMFLNEISHYVTHIEISLVEKDAEIERLKTLIPKHDRDYHIGLESSDDIKLKIRDVLDAIQHKGGMQDAEIALIMVDQYVDTVAKEMTRLKVLLRWRTVEKDGLPDKAGMYAVYNECVEYTISRWDGEDWYDKGTGSIRNSRYYSHWLPISKPEDV